MVEDGKFPEYEYSNIDIIRAHRRNLKQKKHRPIGITACVDEAALIAALACALRGVSFEELVIFGSPVHYTAFIDHDGEAFWFNGKQEYFSRAGWNDLLQTDPAISSQQAFDERMEFDRIIAPRGFCLLNSGISTLKPEKAEALFGEINGFFGTGLRQIAEADDSITYNAPNHNVTSLETMNRAENAEEFRAAVISLAARHPGSVFESALYTFRLLSVANPVAYLHAGFRGPKIRGAVGELGSIDDAIALVAGIGDSTSIFDDRDRIALPDEVLQFNAGSDRERALLLFCLAKLIREPAEGRPVDGDVLFTADESYVRLGERIVNCRTMADVEAPEQPVEIRLTA
jgi:hypothetical protein